MYVCKTSTGIGRLSRSTSNIFWTSSKNWLRSFWNPMGYIEAFLMLSTITGSWILQSSYWFTVFIVHCGTPLGSELKMLGVSPEWVVDGITRQLVFWQGETPLPRHQFDFIFRSTSRSSKVRQIIPMGEKGCWISQWSRHLRSFRLAISHSAILMIPWQLFKIFNASVLLVSGCTLQLNKSWLLPVPWLFYGLLPLNHVGIHLIYHITSHHMFYRCCFWLLVN